MPSVFKRAPLVFALTGFYVEAFALCAKPVYLTFDTGHMGVAPLIAEVLKRQQVKVTSSAANEPTQEGDGTLGEHWAPWWRARAQEGHAFASHAFDHVYWQADHASGGWKMKPSAGPNKGVSSVWTSKQYCAEIQRANTRLQEITGKQALSLFRAPGGKTSPSLLAASQAMRIWPCGLGGYRVFRG
jgi:peptidoglycan/xylan/chitin deacetylase (PgdA/CDA1 family)